jgi:hypothetical protein
MIFRRVVCGLAVAAVVVVALAVALRWRGPAQTVPADPYAAVPFRPRIIYDLPDVTVVNTEAEPYLDTRLTLYVGWTPYRVWVGTLRPGERVTRPLRDFVEEGGERFDAVARKAEHLEVRARMGGYEVHKDFPPPPR